jgi:flagellar motor protein MotB
LDFEMSDTPHNAESHDKPHKHGKGGHGAHGGGGHEEGHEGAPEWLISFADNVVLMMGFFVILLAMNMAKSTVGGGGEKGEHGEAKKQEEAMLDFAIAVREAFNNPVTIDSSNPRDAALVARLRQRAGQGDARDQGVDGKQQDVQSIRPSDYRALSGSVAFADHSSELLDSSKTTIAQIARKIRGLRLIVLVRGHVSSVEAARGPEVAMKLSTERATNVCKALAAEGVAWWQLRLVACADHDRLEAHPNSKAVDKANARVEVILTDEVVPDEVPTRYDDAASNTAWSPGGGHVTASP